MPTLKHVLNNFLFQSKDSYDTAIIPLGSDLSMREKYMTFHKTIRIGRLLEDLDVFAVTLCYKHILNPNQPADISVSPYSIVTACVDQMDIAHFPLRVGMNVYSLKKGFGFILCIL